MHKICVACGKFRLHHGRGHCQQCYRTHMRNLKNPQSDVIVSEEATNLSIENQPIQKTEDDFSRPVDLLVNYLRIKCLNCYKIIESEVACKYSLIYCGTCYFRKTGTKRQRVVTLPSNIKPISSIEPKKPSDVTNQNVNYINLSSDEEAF